MTPVKMELVKREATTFIRVETCPGGYFLDCNSARTTARKLLEFAHQIEHPPAESDYS